MSWFLPAIAGLGTALVGAFGANRAADAARQGAQAAANVQRYMFDQTRADLAPFRAAGADALRRIAAMGDTFQESPAYAFRRGEALRGLDQAAAARGLLGSGARLRAIMRLADQLAAQEYGDWWNRNAALAGIGQTATQATGNAAALAGQGIAGANLAGGQAAAQGIGGMTNAALGGINNALALYALGGK